MREKTVRFISDSELQTVSTFSDSTDSDFLLSIITPARNNISGLITSLTSINNELTSRVQWIIIDDGSDVLISDQLSSFEFNVLVHRHEKSMGAGYSRNAGLAIAEGKYVLFFDADDILNTIFLNKVLSLLNSQDHDLLIFNYFIESESAIVKHMNKSDLQAWALLRKTLNPYDIFKLTTFPWNRIVKRSFLIDHEISFQNTAVFNDLYAVWKMTEYADSIFLVNIPLSTYVNISRNNRLSGIRDSRRLQILIPFLALLRESGWEDDRLNGELFLKAWKKRYLTATFEERQIKMKYIKLLFLFLRKMPRSIIRKQPLSRRILLMNISVFSIFTSFQSNIRMHITTVKKRTVDIIWGEKKFLN